MARDVGEAFLKDSEERGGDFPLTRFGSVSGRLTSHEMPVRSWNRRPP